MYCALKELELKEAVCPVSCMYKKSTGECAHAELAYAENLTPEHIARVLGVPLENVVEEVQKATKRIKVALVADAYISYSMQNLPETVNNQVNRESSVVFRVLKTNPSILKRILLRSRYEAWREMSKVEVSFENLCQLFQKALTRSSNLTFARSC